MSMTAAELVSAAAACQDCGKPHQYVRLHNHEGGLRGSWAARDGHPYRPHMRVAVVCALAHLAGEDAPHLGSWDHPVAARAPWAA